MMATGGGNLQGTLGRLLALDVAQIDRVRGTRLDLRRRTADHLGALEMVDQREQVIGRDDRHLVGRSGSQARV